VIQPAPKPVVHRPKPVAKKEALLPNTRSVARNPDLDGGLVASLGPGVSATVSDPSAVSWRILQLTLGAVLLLSLALVALALAPPWVLPRPLLFRVLGHHDDFVVGGIAIALSIGFALGIVFLLS
jgi:hypothetical protein